MAVKSKIDPIELKRLLEVDTGRGRMRRIADHFGVKHAALLKAIKVAGLDARTNRPHEYGISYRRAWELSRNE